MEKIVAIAIELENGARRFFLTWGRIQDPVDPASVVQVVFQQSTAFALGGKPVKAHLCESLQQAAHEPYFSEAFFALCQKPIPFGKHYEAWRREMDRRMRRGKELYYLGNPEEVSER